MPRRRRIDDDRARTAARAARRRGSRARTPRRSPAARAASRSRRIARSCSTSTPRPTSRVEQRVDARAVLIAHARECRGRVHLSNDEPRWIVQRRARRRRWPTPRSPAPSASAIDGAGSVETSSVSPSSSSAAAMASAQATVLFPTPPLPATIVSRASRSCATSVLRVILSASLASHPERAERANGSLSRHGREQPWTESDPSSLRRLRMTRGALARDDAR